MAILEYFDQLESSPSFLVIVDDDTILSVARLAQLLACYDRKESFLLGECCRLLLSELSLSLLFRTEVRLPGCPVRL